MDSTPILLIAVSVGGTLVLIGLVAYILHRSWGDSLPTHLRASQHDYSAYTGAKSAHQPVPDEEDDQEADAPDAADDLPDLPPHDQPLPDEGLLLIHHPLLLQAIQRSLAEGGSAQQYVVQEGDEIYLSLDKIHDPLQRRQAAEMIQNFQTNNHPGVWDIMNLATLLGRIRPPRR